MVTGKVRSQLPVGFMYLWIVTDLLSEKRACCSEMSKGSNFCFNEKRYVWEHSAFRKNTFGLKKHALYASLMVLSPQKSFFPYFSPAHFLAGRLHNCKCSRMKSFSLHITVTHSKCITRDFCSPWVLLKHKTIYNRCWRQFGLCKYLCT